MSEALNLPDILKTLQAVASLIGVTVLLVDAKGNLVSSNQVVPIPTTPVCPDADTATPGFMRTNRQTKNLPPSLIEGGLGGFLLTLNYDTTARSQFFVSWTSTVRLFARRHSSGTANDAWEDWQEFAKVS